MKYLLLSLALLISTINTAAAEKLTSYLITPPQVLQVDTSSIGITTSQAQSIQQILTDNQFKDVSGNLQWGNNLSLRLHIDSADLNPQSYRITIDKNTITLTGYDWAALFYAKQTASQLLRYSIKEKAPLPTLNIHDWPNFPRRGYMLDVSRDKVPTMESIYQLIDQLATYKTNEFQLYTEHTFAYKNHETVWKNASPLTAEEIQAIDAYCAARHIDLVPNQNSFGHMENWLKHNEYLDLAECPTTCQTKWGKRKRHSLNPNNPKSFELMQELYKELLPNFSSKYFNIGGDETIELCEGLSKDICAKKGKGQVYLDYLIQLNDAANAEGKLAQFWGDIILNHPELIPSLPKNLTALVWGYDDIHPFNTQLPKFKAADLDFYVCPGTSTWRSLIGKNTNAFLNLKNAAIEGQKNGAKGFLNTNWGDNGHWQPASIAEPSLLLGASYAWNYTDAAIDHLEFQLNEYVFQDEYGYTAKALLKLGDAYLKAGIPNGNANAFHLMLRRYKWTMNGNFQTKKLTIAELNAAKQEIKDALEILAKGNPLCRNEAILKQELVQAANLAIHGVHLGIARLQAPELSTANINAATKLQLIEELEPLIARHKELWTIRNRPGGLDDSAQKLQVILDYYKR